MKKLYSWITEHTGLVLVGFLILTVVCTALKPLIGVNYDMNDYLPPGPTGRSPGVRRT